MYVEFADRALEQLQGMKNIQLAGMFATVCVQAGAIEGPGKDGAHSLKIASGPTTFEKVSIAHARLLRALQLKEWAQHVCDMAQIPLSRLDAHR